MREHAPLLVAFVATSAGYTLLDPTEPRFMPWLALYSMQFALYGAIVWRTRKKPLSIAPLLAVALASRVILWFTDPVLEADFYRYLWDGHVTAQGVNPYDYPPEAPELDAVETDYRFFVTWSHIRTIYPPVSQYFFLLAHAVAPDSLLGLKILLTLLDVLTGMLLLRWHPSSAVVYWLNPLVLKEVANSAHIDALPVLLTTVAVFWMSRGEKRLFSWLALALATGAKIYALLLAPLFVRLDPAWRRHAAAAALFLLALYAPFAGAGANLFSGTSDFAKLWVFNAGLYRVVDFLLPAKPVVAMALAALVSWRAWRITTPDTLPREALVVIGALLLLSPVVNAWYVLWILPFAVLTGSVPWLVFTYLVGLGYAWFHDPESAVFFRLVEYGVFFTLLLARPPSIVCKRKSKQGETR